MIAMISRRHGSEKSREKVTALIFEMITGKAPNKNARIGPELGVCRLRRKDHSASETRGKSRVCNSDQRWRSRDRNVRLTNGNSGSTVTNCSASEKKIPRKQPRGIRDVPSPENNLEESVTFQVPKEQERRIPWKALNDKTKTRQR
jgi:hypothetical protein